MSTSPRVSIVMPVYNDADWVASSIESCLRQTLHDVEVIVVDDASTDDTPSIVAAVQRANPQVRLIRQPSNLSAFQARRVGVEAARAPFVMFLDADDELVPEAAATALALAVASSADVSAFGCEVVKPDGSTGGQFESSMQPRYEHLHGEEIVTTLFPVGKTAQGQLWRYLFDKALLLEVFHALPPALTLPRANDLPVAFLALMRARKYVSTSKVLYRYFFRRGASGHSIATVDSFTFMASAIDSVEAIDAAVSAESQQRKDADSLLAAYESARLSVIGNILRYVRGVQDPQLRSTFARALADRVGELDLIRACADFCQDALELVANSRSRTDTSATRPSHIAIRATNLGTGGAQGVVVAQAKYLTQAGFKVTIATESQAETHFSLPPGVTLVTVKGDSFSLRIKHFSQLCLDLGFDLIIDHYVFYNERWPFFALAASNHGVPTIGWLHNFALRPILDGTTRLTFLQRYLPLLKTVVVLSEADVTFWELRGFTHVVYLPNPPSPLLEDLPRGTITRPAPTRTLEIIWWGRLQQSTKRVRELVEIGALLRELQVDFRITIIGPPGPDLRAEQLHALAEQRGIEDKLETTGPLHGDELLAIIERAHVFVSTSIIEGYPLALVEAQALGLPLVMYELPWLAILDSNSGVDSVEQGDRNALARVLVRLAREPEFYERRARGALSAAKAAVQHDFQDLYTRLVLGTLPPAHAQRPRLADVELLLHQSISLAEYRFRLQSRSRASASLKTENAKLRRGRDRAVNKLHHVVNGPSFRLGRALTYIPRMAISTYKRLIGTSGSRPSPPRAHSK